MPTIQEIINRYIEEAIPKIHPAAGKTELDPDELHAVREKVKLEISKTDYTRKILVGEHDKAVLAGERQPEAITDLTTLCVPENSAAAFEIQRITFLALDEVLKQRPENLYSRAMREKT